VTPRALHDIAALVASLPGASSSFPYVHLGCTSPEAVALLAAQFGAKESAYVYDAGHAIDAAEVTIGGVRFTAQTARAATPEEMAALSGPDAHTHECSRSAVLR
jgi:hypothetical protein